MLKKILFFSVTIIFGAFIAYTMYYSYYVNGLYDIVDKATEEERYEDIARMFTSYFDSQSAMDTDPSKDGFMYAYPSLVQTTKTYKDDENKDVTYTSFEIGYSFYSFNLKADQFADYKDSASGTKNDSGYRFYNNDLVYEYPFIYNATTTESSTEGVTTSSYNLVTLIQSLNCAESNIVLTKVNSVLDGAITKVELLGSDGKTVLSYDVDLKFEEEFFVMANELIGVYDECVKTNNEEKWDTFFEDWSERFDQNPTYKKFYSSKELNQSAAVWKTVGVMSLYVVACILVGLLIFKGGRLFKKKNNNTRYQKRAPMRGNTTKAKVQNYIDAKVEKDVTVSEETKEEVKEDIAEVVDDNNQKTEE